MVLITWVATILSVLIISIISLVGVVTLLFDKSQKLIFILVSFAAGSMIGGAMLHLMPEAVKSLGFSVLISVLFILGMFFFFMLEKVIHWRHCHISTSSKHPHPLAYNNLIGDGFHNLIDGALIAASYIVSIPLGIVTTIAVIAHEVPQELGDFGVLIHAGFSHKKAMFYNFVSASIALVGAVLILIIGNGDFVIYLLPITAGGFMYIASADIIPEIHKQCDAKISLSQVAGLISGVLVMYLLLFI